MKIYPITPVPKPRMTQRDKWKSRDCVQRYWNYKDLVKIHNVRLPDTSSYHVVFLIPMPISWSGKRKNAAIYTPHLSRPDKDNLEKGLLDAIYGEDAHVWTGESSKLWSDVGAIVIFPKEFDFGLVDMIKKHMRC